MKRPLLRSSHRVWLVLLLACFALAQCGDDSGSTPLNPATDMGAASMDLADASRQYTMKCSVCHGSDGAPVLAAAPDLRTSTMTVEERVAIIAYGKGTMPPHRGMLDMPTIRGIAVYIEKFRE